MVHHHVSMRRIALDSPRSRATPPTASSRSLARSEARLGVSRSGIAWVRRRRTGSPRQAPVRSACASARCIYASPPTCDCCARYSPHTTCCSPPLLTRVAHATTRVSSLRMSSAMTAGPAQNTTGVIRARTVPIVVGAARHVLLHRQHRQHRQRCRQPVHAPRVLGEP